MIAAPAAIRHTAAATSRTRNSPRPGPGSTLLNICCNRAAFSGFPVSYAAAAAPQPGQSPVAVTPAFSIISTALRTGATGRTSIPAGTLNNRWGDCSTVSASSSRYAIPRPGRSRTHPARRACAAIGVSSRVRRPTGDGGDLYLRTAEEDCADGGPDRPRLGEVPLVHRVEALEVGEVNQAGHHVRGRAADRAEQRGDLAERALGLVLDRLARAGLAGQEHPLTGRKTRRVRPGRRGSRGCDRRFVRHSSSAIFCLMFAMNSTHKVSSARSPVTPW